MGIIAQIIQLMLCFRRGYLYLILDLVNLFLRYLSIIWLITLLWFIIILRRTAIINIIIYYFNLFYCPNYRNKDEDLLLNPTTCLRPYKITNINTLDVLEWYINNQFSLQDSSSSTLLYWFLAAALASCRVASSLKLDWLSLANNSIP